MAQRGRVRIIAGRWRRRLLPVPEAPGLRPTPDRVRETLFNWLSDELDGARCLDLFAGSGALGLEAASRGASSVVMVERSEAVARHLREQVRRLDAQSVVRVVNADAVAWLERAGEAFDVVFVDPPYGQIPLAPLLERLEDRCCLAPGARVFVESREDDAPPPIPSHWQVLHERRAGRVRYHLAAPPGGAR